MANATKTHTVEPLVQRTRGDVLRDFRRLARACGWTYRDEDPTASGRVVVRMTHPRGLEISGVIRDDAELERFLCFDNVTGCVHEIGDDPIVIGRIAQDPRRIRRSVRLARHVLKLNPGHRLHTLFPGGRA